MGKGTFGKVFQCHDRKHNDKVAIKIIRSVQRYIDSARIEADILEDVYRKQKACSGPSLCVKMYSHFTLGDHYCMVFEPLGISLYDLVKRNRYKRLPLHCVRDMARQLIEALEFLHSMELIHTDLKLENILCARTGLRKERVEQAGRTFEVYVPCDTKIKLIDFGGATYIEEVNKSHIINTRQYRGPEVTLEIGWAYASDVWSAGCIVAEMYSGELLFETHDELEHLALIEHIIGEFPMHIIQQVPRRLRDEYFRILYFNEFTAAAGRAGESTSSSNARRISTSSSRRYDGSGLDRSKDMRYNHTVHCRYHRYPSSSRNGFVNRRRVVGGSADRGGCIDTYHSGHRYEKHHHRHNAHHNAHRCFSALDSGKGNRRSSIGGDVVGSSSSSSGSRHGVNGRRREMSTAAVRVEDLNRSSRHYVRNALPLADYFNLAVEDRHSGIQALVQAMLCIDPKNRVTAKDALEQYAFVRHSDGHSYSQPVRANERRSDNNSSSSSINNNCVPSSPHSLNLTASNTTEAAAGCSSAKHDTGHL